MTFQISIDAQLEALLRERAAAAGKDPSEYAAAVLERELRQQALDRLLAPVREAFDKSGMTDDELAEELERAKHAMRAEQKPRKAS